MKSNLIAIAGRRNSGKDTVANMISYISSVGTKASFEDWQDNIIPSTGRLELLRVNFADAVKDIISVILSIPRSYLDDRTKKDMLYYCPKNNNFCNWADLERFGYIYVTLKDYPIYGFDNIINPNFKIRSMSPAIKLREVMQFIGTDIGRKYLGENIWTNIAKIKIINKMKTNGRCYVSDVRFNNECEAIKDLGGKVILINRPNTNNPEHESEEINIAPHYIIDNDKKLSNLFYKVLRLTYEL